MVGMFLGLIGPLRSGAPDHPSARTDKRPKNPAVTPRPNLRRGTDTHAHNAREVQSFVGKPWKLVTRRRQWRQSPAADIHTSCREWLGRAQSVNLSFSLRAHAARKMRLERKSLCCIAVFKAAVRQCQTDVVSAALTSEFGGRIGGHEMPRVQLPAVSPKRNAWNKGRIIGQKRPLLPKQVWAIRARLEIAGYLRDLALFNVAIDSKLRGRDLVKLAITDLVKDGRVRQRVSIIQSKTKKPVQFEPNKNTRDTVIAWVRSPEMIGCRFMFPSRFHDRPHISTRQYGRLVRDWVTAIGLEPSGYGTHSMRRTKAPEIYRKTGNLRAAQLLLGHTKVDSTVRYLGVELEDALSIAEYVDI